MARYHCRKRATIAVDRVGIITQFQFCHATQFIENIYSSLEPHAQIPWRHMPPGSDATPNYTQQCFNFIRWNVLVEHIQEFAQHRSICFWEKLLAFRRQLVDESRFPTASTGTSLSHKP